MVRVGRCFRKKLNILWWGISEEYGKGWYNKKSENAPFMQFPRRNKEAYVGWDVDRHRFVAESFSRQGLRKIGWRKDVYGSLRD